jgi:hypothetical protein
MREVHESPVRIFAAEEFGTTLMTQKIIVTASEPIRVFIFVIKVDSL